jgi:mono/diheme cytochrome c family protein
MNPQADLPRQEHPMRPIRTSLLATALALAALHSAQADSGPMLPRHVPEAYTQECAACHTAYPPGMLPARSWQRIMAGLDKHYGTDASLDAATVQQLSTWLQSNAGTYKRVNEEPTQDRITRSAWFERKHRKIDATVWKLPSVKSAANCAACHAGADKGEFDDDHLRIPAGLDARMRRNWND